MQQCVRWITSIAVTKYFCYLKTSIYFNIIIINQNANGNNIKYVKALSLGKVPQRCTIIPFQDREWITYNAEILFLP